MEGTVCQGEIVLPLRSAAKIPRGNAAASLLPWNLCLSAKQLTRQFREDGMVTGAWGVVKG